MQITSNEIRTKFLEFMESKGHAIIPSAPLVPENDPTVLFNTAGMQPLVPYLLGKSHPSGTRLADSQKCIRTNDIEEVGDNSHLTFFEMLGNWSLGDFFKEESIAWSYEFLTSPEWLGLDPKMLAVTVFEGDEDAPRDKESAEIWKKTGIPTERISYLPKEDNWWAAGDTGPCGGDTEIFYWVGEGEPAADSNVANDEDNWMEIWNNVFMEYNRKPDGTLEQLPNKNVDTGMGLERITATLNGVKSVYFTDMFENILLKIGEVLGVKEDADTQKSMRIIADHSRTATFLIADGVSPSNTDQGYILRRLIRRAIREAYKLGFQGNFLGEVAKVVIANLGHHYKNLVTEQEKILAELEKEENQFGQTLEKGLKEFDKMLRRIGNTSKGMILQDPITPFSIGMSNRDKKTLHELCENNMIQGREAFKLYDTYGFPFEMTLELATEKGLKVDQEGFDKAFAEHQEKSRSASAGKFKGGLADDSEETTRLHSATHLLLAGLRAVVGNHVHQKGSNITPERLRFDFNNDGKVEREVLDKVEEYVNNAIQIGFHTEITEMDKQEAIETGVEGSFWEKYPDRVTVYTMKGEDGTIFSRELCGGPHVVDSKDMGTFKIKKEQASSAGVRRIKAVLVK